MARAWNAGHGWDHGYWNGNNFGRYGYGYGGYGYGLGYGGYWPWYGFDWWPGYYGYFGSYPYGDYYGDYYGGSPYAVSYGDNAYAQSPEVNTNAPTEPPTNEPPQATNEELSESEYYTEALTAFRDGDYANAVRLASHAAIDQPRNQDVHALLMLGLFALGQYRPAAMEAHAVASLGKLPDWPTVYAIYGNVNTYTRQLRALEKFSIKNPSAVEGRFLLGVQYAIDGHKAPAQMEFLAALKAIPKDTVAAKLLTMQGGTVPADIARAQKETKPPVITK